MKKIYKLNFDADYYYDRAEDFIDNGETEKAIYNYYRSLSLEPFNPWIMSDIGMCYYELGTVSEALEWFNRALAVYKNCYSAAFGIVRVMVALERNKTAERFIPLCSHEDLDGYIENGMFFDETDDIPVSDGESPAASFRLVDKDKGQRYLAAAVAALSRGNSDEAEKSLRMVDEKSKAYCEAMYYLALILYDKGCLYEAYVISDNMMRVCPDEIKTYIIRIAVCARLNMPEQKDAAVQKLDKLYPQDFAESIGVAFCLSDIGMYDLALRFFEEAVKMQPYHKSALLLYALCSHNNKMHDKCRSVLVRLSKLYPEDGVPKYYAEYTLRHPDSVIPLVGDLTGSATAHFVEEFLEEVNKIGSLEELEDKYDADDVFYDSMMAFFASGYSAAIVNFVSIIAPSNKLRPVLRELLVRSDTSVALKMECLTWLLVYDRKKEYAILGDDGAVVFEKARIITEENKVMKSVFCRAYAAMKIANINLDRELKQRYAEMKATNRRLMGDYEYSRENAVWLCSSALGGAMSDKICRLLGADEKKYADIIEKWQNNIPGEEK